MSLKHLEKSIASVMTAEAATARLHELNADATEKRFEKFKAPVGKPARWSALSDGSKEAQVNAMQIFMDDLVDGLAVVISTNYELQPREE